MLKVISPPTLDGFRVFDEILNRIIFHELQAEPTIPTGLAE